MNSKHLSHSLHKLFFDHVKFNNVVSPDVLFNCVMKTYQYITLMEHFWKACFKKLSKVHFKPAFTCPKLTMETPEHYVQYVQS